MASLTARLVRAADDLRCLRAEVNGLAAHLLAEGISEGAYMALVAVFDRLGGMPDPRVVIRDGKYYEV